MKRPVRHRRPRHAVVLVLAATLLGGGCGGGGVDTGGADPVTAADPLDWTRASLRPARDVLDVALAIGRFVSGPAPDLVARGAATAETLLVLPGRPGAFFLDWFDADRDGALSPGDGLGFDFGYAPGNGRLARSPSRGVSLPEVQVGPGRVEAPGVFVDLAAASGGDRAAGLAGTFALRYAAGVLGERLAVTRGSSPLRWSRNEATALLDTLDLTLEVQPWAGTWQLRGRVALRDPGLGPLTLEIASPLAGRLVDGLSGPAVSGSLVLRRALGGTLRLLVTGPDAAHLSLDADDDGVFDRVDDAAWSELTTLP